MNIKILSSILVALLVFSSSMVGASSPQTVIVSNDAHVEVNVPSENFGRSPYLKIADTDSEWSFAFLMFNLSGVSYTFNASSEIKLQLRVLNVTSPHVVGVHWCANNTWNEDNLTFDSQHEFPITTQYESAVTVSSGNSWYEWTVTEFVSDAMQKLHFDKLTLVLEAENSFEGDNYVLFYSKDQDLSEYRPRLVFSYSPYLVNPLDTYLKIAAASVVIIGSVFVVYMFSKKRRRKGYYRKSRFQQSVKDVKK